MTFKELQDKDSFGAFDEWCSVADAKKLGIIPAGFHDYFSNICQCGSDNIIKKSASMMMCCNPKCSVKMGFALAETLTRFGVKGIKAASCDKIYASFVARDQQLKAAGGKGLFELNSFIECLGVPFEQYPSDLACSVLGTDFYRASLQIRQEPITFPKLVSNLAIPDLSKDAEKLFSGFSNFVEIADAMKDAGSVNVFCQLRGFNSPMVAYNVKHSIRDIAAANVLFNNALRSEGRLKLNVCMTGPISLNGTRSTKDKYLKECNRLCVDNTGMTLLEINMNSAKETNSFILYSRESGDSKFMVGKRRGVIVDSFGEHEVLMHTDKFYCFIRRLMQIWNQKRAQDSTLSLQCFQEVAKQAMYEIQHPETVDSVMETSTSTTTMTTAPLTEPTKELEMF